MQSIWNSNWASRVSVLALLSALVGCASSRTQAPQHAALERNNPYPLRLLVAPSRTATLFPSTDPDARAVATFNSHVPILLLGPSDQGRVPVHVEGDMPMSGFIPDSDIVARVQRSGFVAGTPVYVAANDLLRIVVVRHDGTAMVRVDPAHLLAFDDSPQVIVRTFGPEHTGFMGTYPLDRMGAGLVVDPQHVLAPGGAARVARPTRLLSSPNGEAYDEGVLDRGVVCRILGKENGIAEVLVGIGPYVRGFVPIADIEQTSEAPATVANDRPPFENPLVALVSPGEPDVELVQVPPGAVVTLDGGSTTSLTGPAYARVLSRTASGADVLVTVTGEIVARGRLPIDALGAAAAMPAAPPRVAVAD